MTKSKLSIIFPFYNNLDLVYDQFKLFSSFSKNVLKQLELILIDDCSTGKLDISKFVSSDVNLSIYRILSNIKWNQGGAHNLGVYVSKSEWFFNGDIDHFLSEKVCRELISMEKNKDTIYYFNRYLINAKKNLQSAPNIYLMRKKVFQNLGGYDEEFCGNYGKEDKLFQYIIKQKYEFKILDHLKIEVNDTGGTKGLDRNTNINEKLLRLKINEYRKGIYKNGKILRFKWKEIYKNENM